jgi:hypothetical protein
MESGGVLYLAAEVVSEGGAPATGGEGLLGDGVAEEHQPRPHLVSDTDHTDRLLDWAGYLGVGDEITATSTTSLLQCSSI